MLLKQHSRPLHLMHVILSMAMGGAEKLVYEMVMNTDPSRLRVSVCCLESVGSLGEKLQDKGIEVLLCERREGVDFGVVGALRRLVVERQIDVVHAHQYTPMFYTACAVVGLPGMRVVYTEHGRHYPERRNWKRFLINPLLARGIDHIVSISESTKRSMTRYDNFPADRIRVIRNGVDFRSLNGKVDTVAKRLELGVGEACPVMGTAARLEEIKNIPMMLRMFSSVLQEYPDAVLLIAGDGSQREFLEALARELGIARSVRFLGMRFDVPEILKILDLFILTSFTEGISLTLLESMASGVTPVATDVGGNAEVVEDGVCGHLVPVGDERGMAQRITALLHDTDRLQQMGSRARERVLDLFDFDVMINRYQSLYTGGTEGGNAYEVTRWS